MIQLSYNGKRQPLSAWSKETGLSVACLYSRMKAGWSVEKILTASLDQSKSPALRRFTKNEAELALNGTPLENLPGVLAQLIKKDNYNGRKFGEFLRSKYRADFDRWFENQYSRQPQAA